MEGMVFQLFWYERKLDFYNGPHDCLIKSGLSHFHGDVILIQLPDFIVLGSNDNSPE